MPSRALPNFGLARFARLQVPFRAVAAMWILVLLCLVAGALTIETYRATQQMLGNGASTAARFIGESLSEKIRLVMEPAEAELNLLAHSELTTPDGPSKLLATLPTLLGILSTGRRLDATYVGYSSGEFLLIRNMKADKDREFYKAPADTALVVQIIAKDEAGKLQGGYQYYDQKYRLLGERADPDYKYDPRTRPWYIAAQKAGGTILTEPYIFATTREIGVTLARPARDNQVVVGIDQTLSAFAAGLKLLTLTPSTEIALIDDQGRVLGYKDPTRMMLVTESSEIRVANIQELGIPVLAMAAKLAPGTSGRTQVTVEGKGWQLLRAEILGLGSGTLSALIAVPDGEMFAQARTLLIKQLVIAGIILAIAIALGLWTSGRLVRPLNLLAKTTNEIASFDFRGGPKVKTRVSEVAILADALDRMKGTIRQFLDIGKALSTEPDLRKLLSRVLDETIGLVGGDGGAIYLLSPENDALTLEVASWENRHMGGGGGALTPLKDVAIERESENRLGRQDRRRQRPVSGPELRALGLSSFVEGEDSALSIVIVPLMNRRQKPLGLLLLMKKQAAGAAGWSVDSRLKEFVRAISGNAGISIENKLLLQAEKDLMNSLIRLIAGAIDAKSPYTGGHCQRVPVVTRMLAEAACAETTGPFKDFNLSTEEWEAVEIASWLHDCGKVTTPEFVVDKATKLETIYDRIHEVRMRFELLKCAAQANYWRGIAEGGDEAALRGVMEAEHRALDEDFAFVAVCNEGGEFMDPARLERLMNIAKRTWTRTIDDCLGVSYEERARKDRSARRELPVEEPLLCDREDHITVRSDKEILSAENPWGIRVETPPYKFNRGELYNLAIGRGTLTNEERYIINDHMTQTIAMLGSLPLPRHLKNVPELAGGHHEKMDGTGYPKRLKRAQMSPVARMMAIADVFEALTAADRPYKRGKKLSEVFKIMTFMKRDNHLDPDLLDLFARSEIWRTYAEKYLDPTVDTGHRSHAGHQAVLKRLAAKLVGPVAAR
jgi:response regulator RpfG family c-di-GMP phosphodiesterase/HAMP domain-containing protein